MMNPSPEWRDEARRNRRDANLRANEAPQPLHAPAMPQARRGPFICCGYSMERSSPEYRMIQRVYIAFVVVGTVWVLADHDSSQDGMSLAAYAFMLALTMCFGPLLILSPFVVAALCKCYYHRKIEAAVAQTLLAQAEATEARDGGRTAAEEARRERMRAEMAASVMSGLRDNGLKPDAAEPGEFDGKSIVEGHLLGEIVELYGSSGGGGGGGGGKPTPTGIGASPLHSSVGARASGRLGASEMGPALGLIATGRVVSPGDWRLHVDAGVL
jgi:hypothetical protein